MSGAYSEFFQRLGINFRFFFKHNFVSAELILSKLSTKIDFTPRKNFQNLHTVMAILVLFKQFLGNVCHIFGP